jgi:hypothetical protein
MSGGDASLESGVVLNDLGFLFDGYSLEDVCVVDE